MGTLTRAQVFTLKTAAVNDREGQCQCRMVPTSRLEAELEHSQVKSEARHCALRDATHQLITYDSSHQLDLA